MLAELPPGGALEALLLLLLADRKPRTSRSLLTMWPRPTPSSSSGKGLRSEILGGESGRPGRPAREGRAEGPLSVVAIGPTSGSD